MPQRQLEKLDFPDNRYTVSQSLVRNRYSVHDSQGELVLKAKQKLFRMKEDFPFADPDGSVVFRVKAEQIMDIAGDYAVIDEETGEKVAVLEKKYTLFRHMWKIREPETERLIAIIESRSLAVSFLRSMTDLFSLLPHKYSIKNPEAEEIGRITGKFSLRDHYTVSVEDSGSVPREIVIAAAVSIDAIERN